MQEIERAGGLLGNFAHLTEIINDSISGIIAFLLYWPFVWLFFNSIDVSGKLAIIEIGNSYKQFLGVSSPWLTFPFIIIALPSIGLLNRAIINTLIDTLLIKYFSSYIIPNEISKPMYKFSIKTLNMQLGRTMNDEYLLDIDSCINPCWKLEGSFDFVGFRHWLIKNKTRKMYWDWEHFLDWVYKTYYQSFIMFIILYFILLIRFGLYTIANFLFAFIPILLTYALYREFLRHHIAWILMDLRFYVEYLIEERRDIESFKKKSLKKFLIDGNYKEIKTKIEDDIWKDFVGK